MKTKIITGLKKEVLVIELLEDTKSWEFIDGHFWIDDKKTFIKGFSPFHKLLGKPDEIKEEDAKELVGTEEYVWYNQICAAYVFHGKSKKCYTESAVKSLLSALESEIYWNVNPLGTEPNHIDYKFEKYKGEYHFKSESHKSRYGNAYEKWQQAEFDTFDRNRTLIFVKD